MKKLLFTLLLFTGCTSAVDQFNELKRPAIVVAVHKPQNWWESSNNQWQIVIRDHDGTLISIEGKDAAPFVDKYLPGDTIK